VGAKTNLGNPVEMAGLTSGHLYGLKVSGLTSETDGTVLAGPVAFAVHDFGDVSAMTGAQLQTASVANGVTGFQRPEDGAWDPNNPNDFYFVTTASFTGKSRLWRAHFTNPAVPTLGGTVEILLNGTEGQKMMDNLAINGRGHVVIQEDPGNQDHIAKIWQYDVATDTLTEVAHHDENRFAPGAPDFLTRDEESSGVIDVSSILGEGWYLLDVQAHYNIGDPELVQDGQLLAMHIPPGKKFKK
jgi:secreted PhoX family phosphatase